MTVDDELHVVVAVAVPVLSGVGGRLQGIVSVGGQVMVTWPSINTKGAIASQPKRTHCAVLRMKGWPWGLEPG